jgi:hypothetical protein
MARTYASEVTRGGLHEDLAELHVRRGDDGQFKDLWPSIPEDHHRFHALGPATIEALAVKGAGP